MTDRSFTLPLVSSCAIHLALLLMASMLLRHTDLRRPELLPISLVDLPLAETAARTAKVEPPPAIKQASRQSERLEPAKPLAKTEDIAPLPAPSAKDEPPKSREANPAAGARTDTTANMVATTRTEGGGSESSTGNLTSKGDVGVAPGSGTAGGGGGTAVAGLGRGFGAPGLPAQQTILRTNREAKAIQTIRATYPAMALRAGLESDVTLRIELDPQGIVTKAEIVKSGGAGFDEEALKAVKLSRFEPAQRDGQNVPAEFTFVYRFRLQR